MKSIFTFLVLLASNPVFANSNQIDILPGDSFIQALEGTVSVGWQDHGDCPDQSQCEPLNSVSITYTYHGCMDRVETLYKIAYGKNNVDIYATALQIKNKDSIKAFCQEKKQVEHLSLKA